MARGCGLSVNFNRNGVAPVHITAGMKWTIYERSDNAWSVAPLETY
ncbi:MAG: hypothetical protein R2867_22165 [Caldilineaceae bacterium]